MRVGMAHHKFGWTRVGGLGGGCGAKEGVSTS